MRAMILDALNQALRLADVPLPTLNPQQVLIRVHTCGICRTDLHIVDGELTNPKLPLIPGHRIVGAIAKIGEQVKKFHLGEQVGVPWVGHTCNHCRYCLTGKENLCDRAEFTILTTSSNSFPIVDSGARIRLDIKN